jgi:UDP-glucose:(heptosyl)LPS alpha-1,3-glucosyltransferase
MKLALVHKRFDRLGGAEWDCYESARQLAARGHDVHLVVGECRTAVPDGITVHRVPVVRAGQIAKLLSFAFLAPAVWRRVGADVVIGYGRTVGHDLFRASGGCHRQYLVDLAAEGGALEAGRQWMSPYEHAMLAIERRQYRPGSARVILAVSELARREILATYPRVPPATVAVLPYGVDVARFDPANRARHGAAIRRELGLSPEHPVVLTVGTGFRRKGVGVLLEIWKRAAPAGAALVVAGNDQHLAAWRRAARGIDAPVVFTGPRADVERLYAAADLFVLASVQEAFGMVVLEALAAGLPVVTSRMAGAAELLTGALARLVVDDPRDPTALAAAIARGLAPDARADLGRAARAVAETHRLEDAVRGLEAWCATLAGARELTSRPDAQREAKPSGGKTE